MNRLHEFDGMKFDIRFTLNRYTYVVQHRALDLVYEHDLLDVVFPEECAPFPSLVDNKDFEFINKMVFSNKEQREAVCNIIEGCMRPAPYIVFGPPGTGKTVTLVEAILQIKKLFHSSYVLVCAPSNATCDYLAQKLSLNCSTKELLRLHSSSRDFNSVPKDLLRYSNASGVKFERVSKDDLARYRIIVCTLTTSNRFAVEFDAYKRNMYHFTHVFIDEAGQAIEPQSLVAIGGILGHVSPHYPGGQLILAGDPKQLGPICSSSIAEKCGLGLSLLERLMEHCPLYQRDKDGKYDTRYITKLLDNFRSHPSLLELPNRLFYDGELRANCGPEVLNDPLCSTILLKTKNENPVGFTCVFHAVIGQERQEGKSPSYFNQLEIDAVMRYVAVLLGNTLDVEVEQSEIGIIAPYIRQVYKLKQRLEAKGWGDVEVGSTEAFQGREKRVILISTVRSNRNLLAYDKKYKLGFLVDPKRFNVAITRARSLMIVVGCPHVLESDPNWSALIMHSKDHGSFEGCNFNLRSDTWTREVVSRVEGPAKNKNV